jgi:DNA repair exonuclease SbcCD ATPase subunit
VQLDVARKDLVGVRAGLAEDKEVLERLIQAQGNDVDDLMQARAKLAALKAAENPFTAFAEQKVVRMAEYKEDLRSKVGLLADIESLLSQTEYWVKAFKDVRLFLVAEALQQLEIETNSALVELGLHGWAIKYSPDAETKSGTVKRGFTVLIESPTNSRPVPWAAWSGGERQRLRVAAQMGLSNLITSYTGADSFIEVWDEPSNGMSEQGIADLLSALASRAQSNRRQVWVVDHRSLASGLFDASVLAVKSGGTTILEQL